MSYAQAASKGPKQSPEEARAPPVPEIVPSDASTESLVDVDSPHVSSVPSDYKSHAVKTETQAERLEREALDEEKEVEAEYNNAKREAKATAQHAKDKTSQKASEVQDAASEKASQVKKDVSQKSSEVKKEVNQRASETKDKAVEVKDEVKKVAKEKADKVSDEIKAASRDIQENSDNPVIVGNAVVVAALSAALGFGAYRKYTAGELTWKVVGLWAGVVGLFAAGDYYISQQLFRNKYPKK